MPPVVNMSATLINADHDVGAYSEVRRFKLLDARSQEHRDLLHLLQNE
jgi:hypothetical protein